MALIKCEKCGKEISSTMNKCPHCGYERKETTVKSRPIYNGNLIYEVVRGMYAVLIASVVAMCFNFYNVGFITKRIGYEYGSAFEDVQLYVSSMNRFFLLLVMYILGGAVVYFWLKQVGENKLIRFGFMAALSVAYTIIIFFRASKIIPLIDNQLERYLTDRYALTYCIAVGFSALIFYMCMGLSSKKKRIILTICEIAINVLFLYVKNRIILTLGLGVAGFVNPLFSIVLIVLMAISCAIVLIPEILAD